MDLKNVGTEALEKELERRRFIKDTPPPVMNPAPDLGVIVELCRTHVEEIETGAYHPDSDFIHYLYEAVIDAFYGETFWTWKREKTE